MANHGGINGLQHRPADRYHPTLAEARERGAKGGTANGHIRHSAAKWRAVDAVLKGCKAGTPAWEVLADLYDSAYRAGYGAQYNAATRRARDVRAKDRSDALVSPVPPSNVVG